MTLEDATAYAAVGAAAAARETVLEMRLAILDRVLTEAYSH